MTEFGVCETPDVLRVIYFIKIIINIVKIIVPIILIIFVTVDCAKGVINEDKKVGDSLKLNINKIISAILIFTVPTIVDIVLEIIDEKTDYVSCWKNADSDRIEELQVKWDAYQEELERKKNQNMQDSDVVFSENITFEFEVVDNGTYIPYALYTPSTASTSGDIPLIVWLHGATDESTNQAKIETRGLPRAIAEWDLLNFNAYVVAPQITSGWHVAWYNSSGKNAVDSVVAYLIENYNIDTNKIIIAGHSNGGIGALYMAVNDNNNYYAAVVSISGGRPANLSSLKIPVHGYTGEKDYTSNYNFTMHTLGNLFGSENVFNIIGSDHAQVSWTAFELDEDGNNRSDAIEWILEQSKE